MALKNLNEFTDEIVGLIHDAKAIETKVTKISKDTNSVARFYFDEIALNAAKIEQTLNELFALSKPKKKKGGKSGK